MTDPSVRDVLRTIAAVSLDSDRDRRARIGVEQEPALLAEISRERLGGLAVAAVAADRLVITQAGFDDLCARHEEQLALDLRLEQVLIDAAGRLDAAGIEYRALKGPLVGQMAYEDPALRSFGDIDVLVRGPAFDAAVAELRALGFERAFLEPRAGFDARFSKGSCLERDDGIELDLHRTLAPGAFGIMLERADLFAPAPFVFRLGCHEITGLDREMAFVHACFHAALGNHPPRLVPLHDVAQLFFAGVDEALVMDLAASTRCASVFKRAFGLLADELGVHLEGPMAGWTHAHRPSRFDRWALQSYANADRSYAGQVATSLWVLPSMRDRAAYSAALVFPTRDYVRAHERAYTRRLSRGVARPERISPAMNGDPARYSSLGLPVSFHCGDADLRRRLDELYSACRGTPAGPIGLELDVEFDEGDQVFELAAFGESLFRSPVRDDVLEWIAWKVNSVALERERSELVLHAAAVARQGRAAIVTGSSGAGKSTLAAGLTLRGMEYMGDDSLIVEGATGQIRSNPKPIALADRSRVALAGLDPTNADLRHARRLFAPAALGAVVAAECPVEPALIVHAAFRPDAPTAVTPLGPAAAAELLAEQSFNFAALGSAGLPHGRGPGPPMPRLDRRVR